MKRSGSISGQIVLQALLLLCTLGVIWGVIALHLRHEYARALRDGETRTVNLARAFEETVSRSIAALDQTVQHVRDLYVLNPEHFRLNDWLRDKTVLHKISVQVGIADASGLILTTTAVNPPPNVSILDREHFQFHRAVPEDRLFISKPVIGRSTGRISIQFTRRITGEDGRFSGVVIASLDPLSLGGFRESSPVGEGFEMLVGRDGVIRAERPAISAIGASVLPPPTAEMARMTGPGISTEGNETANGPEGIVSYRGVTGYPLFVAVGISRHAAFASYADTSRDSILAGAFLTLIVLFVGLVTLHQRYRLARFHKSLTVTLDNISQGILMIDSRRRMPVVNRRVAELLDLPMELARPGAEFDELVRWQQNQGEFRTELTGDNRIATMVNKGGIDPNMLFYERSRANGTVLEIRTTILPDGGAVRTYTDVTERKKNERDMLRARDAAEAGVRARNEFLAVMSHEIRTPMNGIIGATGLLRDMPLDPEQKEYVRIIRESSDHLSSLIENILDFTRLDAGRLELEEIAFDPVDVIQSTIAMLSGQAAAKGLTLVARTDAGIPGRVSGDPSRLRQVLVNLIGNGIKFTNNGGVTVETRAGISDDGTVTLNITVGDTGIGIDPDSTRKLFSAFTQVDSSISRRFGGTGLGLAICMRLVALMGGTIDVDSVPGQGSKFRFSIELRPAAAEERSPAAGRNSRTESHKLKVLLAEDNPTNRHVAMRMLNRMGHTVDAVEDGAQAVAAAAATDYDVILMDIMMPEVDGLTATRMIRASAPPRGRTKIVGLTANALPSDREACEAAGMDGFLTKPVTLERLRGALEQASAHDTPIVEHSASTVLDTAFLNHLAEEIGSIGAVEVVRAFVEDAPLRMTTIEAAVSRAAVQTIRQEAHALAGSARTIGLTRLGEAASSLFRLSGEGLPDRAAVDLVAAAFRDALPLAAAWADAHETLAASIV